MFSRLLRYLAVVVVLKYRKGPAQHVHVNVMRPSVIMEWHSHHVTTSLLDKMQINWMEEERVT